METISSPSKASPSGNEEPITLDTAVRRLRELDDDSERRFWIKQHLRYIPIDDLLSSLRTEAARYYAINSLISLRLAQALIHAAELGNRPDMRVLGLMHQGDALRGLGRYQESVKVYEEAQRSFLAQGNEIGWARIHTGWIYSMHFLGRGAEALETVGPAYDVLVRHQQWLYAAKLDVNTAIVHHWSGRYDEAMRHYDRAQQMFAPLGAIAEEPAARTKMYKAEIFTLLGDFRAALALHAEVRESLISLGTTAEANRQSLAIADVYASQGRYTRALRLYNEALAAFEQDGQDVDAAWAALNIVTCYLTLNRNTEALGLAEETVDRFERCGTPTEAAKARFACALAHARLGEGARALALLDEAARTFTATGLTSDLGNTILQRARLYLGEEDWLAVVQEAEAAQAIFAQRGLIVRQMQADLLRARALLGLGDLEAAASTAQSVLVTARARDLHWLAPECHHILAGVARTRGEMRRALAACRTAIDGIEHVQSRLAVELRGNFLADKLHVYQDAIDCCLRLADPQSAFVFLERAKSRALVDYLTSHPDVRIRARSAANQELADELARLRGEHDWFYNRLYGYGLTRRSDNARAEAETATLQAAIREREVRIARILERLALHRADGEQEREALIPPLADQESVLPDLDVRTALLEYYFHDRGGAVFVVSQRGMEVVDLETSPWAIRQMLNRWQLNLDATARALVAGAPLDGLARNARGILASLHGMLLGPVAAALAAIGCERLVIIPYGPTHSVPFHALYDGRRHLLEAMEVTTCPSSNLLQLCDARSRRERPARGALVVAYSDSGRLPFVLEEAETVAALLSGECLIEEQATRAALAASAPRHAIVHLAAHGEARQDNPTFAHLRLADGQLNPADVFNLNLDGALVTLSACETGRGVVMGGDELIGLSRGFLYAGAATLVQSLWRVEDGSAARLMEQFYRGLCSGQSSGAALREAQCALLGNPDTGVHPYFWAPFQLLGASGTLEIGG